MDLRERIVAACANGATQQSASLQFGVCLKTVQRYVCRARAGELAPKPLPGKARRLNAQGHKRLQELVAQKSDWTLASLSRELEAQTGLCLGSSTLHDALKRERISYKKRVESPASVAPPNAQTSGKS